MHTIALFSLATFTVAAAPTDLLHPATSKGFTLVAKVTDAKVDFTLSINNWVFSTIHTGAALNVAVLSEGYARVFYENGTAAEAAAGNTSIITDGATPPVPFGVSIQSPTQFDSLYPTEHSIFVNAGYGTRASIPPSGLPVLRNGQDIGGGTFVACNNSVPYYQNMKFITLQYAYGNETVPSGCAPVVLLPQCAALSELPDNAYASHEFAVEVRCFGDVGTFDIGRIGRIS
jgi:hypothetical protein